MSTVKKYLKSKPVCKVTFKLLKEQYANAENAALAGEFNDWQPTPMKKLKSGDFTVTLDLETGRDYEFRYLLNKTSWQNDWHADEYRPSGMGYEDNSVLKL